MRFGFLVLQDFHLVFKGAIAAGDTWLLIGLLMLFVSACLSVWVLLLLLLLLLLLILSVCLSVWLALSAVSACLSVCCVRLTYMDMYSKRSVSFWFIVTYIVLLLFTMFWFIRFGLLLLFTINFAIGLFCFYTVFALV